MVLLSVLVTVQQYTTHFPSDKHFPSNGHDWGPPRQLQGLGGWVGGGGGGGGGPCRIINVFLFFLTLMQCLKVVVCFRCFSVVVQVYGPSQISKRPGRTFL